MREKDGMGQKRLGRERKDFRVVFGYFYFANSNTQTNKNQCSDMNATNIKPFYLVLKDNYLFFLY